MPSDARAEADEAARHARATNGCSIASATASPASRCAPRSSSASRARRTTTSRSCRDFVKTLGFDHVGVFTYSHEEGTSAHGFDDDVPAKVKQQRQSRLMSLQKQIVAQLSNSRVGQHVRLLVDGPSSEHELVLRARLEGQAPRHRPGGLPHGLRPVGFHPRPVHSGGDRRKP